MKLNIIIGILCFTMAQTMTWFQLNGQFLWNWFKDHPFLLALLGVPISYLYMWATKFTVDGFNGTMWPARFMGFGIGILIYGLLVGIFFNEVFQVKTLISIILAVSILAIQIYWK